MITKTVDVIAGQPMRDACVPRLPVVPGMHAVARHGDNVRRFYAVDLLVIGSWATLRHQCEKFSHHLLVGRTRDF